MNWDTVSQSDCPIARTLAVVGDRWTLLILRELAFGVSRFDELLAQTGMSSFLLSTRLKRLVQNGVLERRQYTDRPPRFEYFVTSKGRAFDVVLLSMRNWGMEWTGYPPGAAPAISLVSRNTGLPLCPDKPVMPEDWPFRFSSCVVELGGKFRQERAGRHAAFINGRRHHRVPDLT